ncbi:DUF1934 domain-containing protein [Fructilactobacillus vespulae]|uniref:DUF1934 domain-containing protein n=1 Tax=Fructilactobacillus vespulae TaxID=1249630 RepID=UPI0039B68418
MANNNLKKPVNVIVDTKIVQDGNQETHHFEEKGELSHVNNKDYLRYQETVNGTNTLVTFKIDEEQTVHLKRSADVQLHLEFNEGQTTASHYETPYGKLQIGTLAQKVDVTIDDEAGAGHVNVDYELYSGSEKVGDYQIKLQFMA